jgi:LPXTG-motif cell wall-anchored protein
MKGTVVVSAAASNTGATPSTATPAQPARSAAAPTRDTLPNTGLNLLVVVLLAALFTGSGALLRRRVAR